MAADIGISAKIDPKQVKSMKRALETITRKFGKRSASNIVRRTLRNFASKLMRIIRDLAPSSGRGGKRSLKKSIQSGSRVDRKGNVIAYVLFQPSSA